MIVTDREYAESIDDTIDYAVTELIASLSTQFRNFGSFDFTGYDKERAVDFIWSNIDVPADIRCMVIEILERLGMDVHGDGLGF